MISPPVVSQMGVLVGVGVGVAEGVARRGFGFSVDVAVAFEIGAVSAWLIAGKQADSARQASKVILRIRAVVPFRWILFSLPTILCSKKLPFRLVSFPRKDHTRFRPNFSK